MRTFDFSSSSPWIKVVVKFVIQLDEAVSEFNLRVMSHSLMVFTASRAAADNFAVIEDVAITIDWSSSNELSSVLKKRELDLRDQCD